MNPRCPQCGYDLTGIGRGATARCPECGRGFDPSRPRDLVPQWPSPTVLLLLLCVPPLAVYAIAVPAMWMSIAALARPAGVLGGFIVLGILIGASVLGLIVVPGLVLRRLRGWHGLEGGGIGFGVALVAVVVNLFVWLCMLVISMTGVAFV